MKNWFWTPDIGKLILGKQGLTLIGYNAYDNKLLTG